jgi:hypothetical protein
MNISIFTLSVFFKEFLEKNNDIVIIKFLISQPRKIRMFYPEIHKQISTIMTQLCYVFDKIT